MRKDDLAHAHRRWRWRATVIQPACSQTDRMWSSYYAALFTFFMLLCNSWRSNEAPPLALQSYMLTLDRGGGNSVGFCFRATKINRTEEISAHAYIYTMSAYASCCAHYAGGRAHRGFACTSRQLVNECVPRFREPRGDTFWESCFLESTWP